MSRKPKTHVAMRSAVTEDKITIVLSRPTPSLNETKSMHWAALAKLKGDWASMLLLAGAKMMPRAKVKRRVEVWRYGEKDLDEDNLPGGAKSVLIDNLKQFGLVVDDSPKWAELRYFQARPDKGISPHTVVVLRDLEATK